MALTVRHWAAAALLGCAAVAVAFLPPEIESPPRPPFTARAEPGAARQIGTSVRRDLQALLLLQRRDAALALLRATRPSGPGIAMLVDPSLRDPRQHGGVAPQVRALAAVLDSAATMLAPFDTGVRLAVMATHDTDYSAPHVGGWVGLRGPVDLFPDAIDGRTCVVMIPLGSRTTRTRLSVAHVLGPCGFYAAFGKPGADIARWLATASYHSAGAADWRKERPRDAYDLADALRYMSPSQAWLGIGYAGLTLDGAACAAGEVARCRPLTQDPPQYLPPQIRDARGPLAHMAMRYWWMDDEQSWYLADLIRAMGRERFARFWISPLPRDSAFESAFGVSMDEWTHRWLVDRRPSVRVGSAIRLSSGLLGVLLAVLCVGGGAYYTTRRQIG